MSDLPRLLRALTAEVLAIDRRTLDAFVGVIRRRGLEGVSFDGHELHAELHVAHPRAGRRAKGDRNVQVIPIVGVIANRTQSLGVGALQLGYDIDQAAASSRVDAIVLDIDSPGGTVTGVPELAEKIFAARQKKPVVAVANGLMASAAYWVGAAADEIVASPSSEIGSIGVFALHEDWSKALEDEGVVVTEISAGKYKTEGAPWKPLDEEAAEFFHERVAEAYDWFVKDVARFRGDSVANVRNGYGEGRVLGAKQAKAVGLIDRIDTLEGTVARLTSGHVPSAARLRARSSSLSVDDERLRLRRKRLGPA